MKWEDATSKRYALITIHSNSKTTEQNETITILFLHKNQTKCGKRKSKWKNENKNKFVMITMWNGDYENITNPFRRPNDSLRINNTRNNIIFIIQTMIFSCCCCCCCILSPVLPFLLVQQNWEKKYKQKLRENNKIGWSEKYEYRK